jgi:hypothetical protein
MNGDASAWEAVFDAVREEMDRDDEADAAAATDTNVDATVAEK